MTIDILIKLISKRLFNTKRNMLLKITQVLEPSVSSNSYRREYHYARDFITDTIMEWRVSK